MPADILSTAEVAALTGFSRKTVYLRGQTSPRWSNCIIGQTCRSTDWSRARLLAAGILTDERPVAAPVQALSFDVSLMPLRVG
jgi:hypothetical protein